MVLETTIKVSNKLKEALKEKKQYGESYNDLIIAMFVRLEDQGWRYYEA